MTNTFYAWNTHTSLSLSLSLSLILKMYDSQFVIIGSFFPLNIFDEYPYQRMIYLLKRSQRHDFRFLIKSPLQLKIITSQEVEKKTIIESSKH